MRSAAANAEDNHEMDADELYVSAAYVDEGPTLKRIRPRARGRADRIREAHEPHYGRSAEREQRRSEEGLAMGQKVHPYGLRLGIIRDWQGRWYANKREYADLLHEDLEIRKHIKERFYTAGVSRVEIERAANRVKVTIHTARPGMVIGKGGAEVDRLRKDLEQHDGQADPDQHYRDQGARAGRPAGGGEHRLPAGTADFLPAGHAPGDAAGHAPGRPGHQGHGGRPARAGRKSPAPSGRPRGPSRCTRCGPTSTTGSPRRTRPTAASASRCGFTRARCCPSAEPAAAGDGRGGE